MRKPNVMFLLGGPGSGKGTHGRIFTERYGIPVIGAGDCLREEIAAETEVGNMCAALLARGEIVPGELTVSLILKKMRCMGWENGTFIIDGFPRNYENVEAWSRIVKDQVNIVLCIYLECSVDVMRERLFKRSKSSGRCDDNAATIEARFNVYSEATIPVKEYFNEKGLLYTIDTNEEWEVIWERDGNNYDKVFRKDVVQI